MLLELLVLVAGGGGFDGTASEMRAFLGGRPAPLDTFTGGVVAGAIVVGGCTAGDSLLTEAVGSTSSDFTLEMLGRRLRFASEERRPRRRSEFIFGFFSQFQSEKMCGKTLEWSFLLS